MTNHRTTPHDLVLSSGFLAMARHCGVLKAIEDNEVSIRALCGTSSGALVGALWLSGMSATEIAAFLTRDRPLHGMAISLRPWRGLFHLGPLISELREVLPATFAALPKPFAAGVADHKTNAHLLTQGDLPSAVAASCAMPYLFQRVTQGETRWADGGAADRIMIGPWRTLTGTHPTIIHHVDRSAGVDTELPPDALLIRSPRSRAAFWSWRDFEVQMDESYAIATELLQ